MLVDSSLNLTNPKLLILLLQQHGFTTRKGLGQHFLISPNALRAIVAACELTEELPILEIGAGVGTVTRALAEAGARVNAVELDERAIAVLQETVGHFPKITIIHQDIMKTNLDTLFGTQRWTVVGNLPYYITTPVISRLLENSSLLARIVLLIQREVADRLSASPGSKIYGSLSVYAQVFARVERIIKVPKGAFLPPPTVESTVIRLNIFPQPLVPAHLQTPFFATVRAAFGQRRKMIENALAGGGILHGEREMIHAALLRAKIDPSSRAEMLGVEEFLRLTEELLVEDTNVIDIS